MKQRVCLFSDMLHVLLIHIPFPFKGGSVGKGTAVKEKADIDCVVFLNDVKTMEQHKSNLKETKNRLESCLKQSAYRHKITLEKQTPFAVKFKLRQDELSKEFHIDLLPTFTTGTTEQSRSKILF